MAREHRKDNQKPPKSHDRHKSHKPQKSYRSSSPPKPQKIRKLRKPKYHTTKTPPPQPIVLDPAQAAQLNMLFAKLSELRVHESKQTSPLKKVALGTRAVKPSPSSLQVVKPRKTVSIAGVFKKAKRQQKEKTPDPELLTEFQDGLETAYVSIQATSKSTFDSIHANFKQRINAARESDAKFFTFVTEATKKLSAPLADEDVALERRKNGKLISETVSIGSRVTAFKSLVEKESANLKELWRQWAEIQDEYMELGIDVFGTEAMGGRAAVLVGRERGFKMEKDELNAEHDAALEELNGEVEEIGEKSLKRMKASERELDLTAKKEQELLIRHFLFA